MNTKLLASTLGLACGLVLAGCATPSAHTAVPFDASAFAPYSAPGNCRITGQAFLTTRGGEVRVGAGRTVSLTPATPFIREVRALRDRGIMPISVTPEVSAEIKKHVRRTIADAQGNFEFADLPAGDYLLETLIEWEVPSSYGMHKTGGMVVSYVTIVPGETKRVVLTS